MLENRIDWNEYKQYCKENNIEPYLTGFIRWSANKVNINKRYPHIKIIQENQQLLNDVCRG